MASPHGATELAEYITGTLEALKYSSFLYGTSSATVMESQLEITTNKCAAAEALFKELQRYSEMDVLSEQAVFELRGILNFLNEPWRTWIARQFRLNLIEQ
jgi:hypothetical protein